MQNYQVNPEGPPLSVSEFHKAARVCRNTVDRDIQAGKIPTIRLGKRIFIPRAWAHRFLTTGER